jgi:hypothetical protein
MDSPGGTESPCPSKVQHLLVYYHLICQGAMYDPRELVDEAFKLQCKCIPCAASPSIIAGLGRNGGADSLAHGIIKPPRRRDGHTLCQVHQEHDIGNDFVTRG